MVAESGSFKDVEALFTCGWVRKGLVTNYGEGGLQNGRGGNVKFYPYEKGGRKKF